MGPLPDGQFDDETRAVLQSAQAMAAKLGENYVGTEHVLLGLLQSDKGQGSRILARLGVDTAALQGEIRRQITQGHGSSSDDMPFTPRGLRVIDLAINEAQSYGAVNVTTGHLLAGLIREHDGCAARTLTKFGITEVRVGSYLTPSGLLAVADLNAA